jgi:hypothetical protein
VVRGHPVRRHDPRVADVRCELTGPIARSLLVVLRSRFERVTVRGPLLIVGDVDQAAVRALLILLWDAGLGVRAVSVDET